MTGVSQRTSLVIDGSETLDVALVAEILSACDDCIKVIDLDGNITFMSAGGMRVMEVDDFETVRNCPWPDFWKDEGNKAALDALASARAGKSQGFIGTADTVKGNPRWWEVKVSPILGEDGKPDRILSISRDITGTKKAEEAALRSQRRMKDTLKAGSLGYWELDLKTMVLDTSDVCRENFGRDGGHSFSYDDLLSAIHPDDLPTMLSAVNKTMENGADYDVQYRVVRPDDTISWVLARGQLVRDEHGQAVAMCGVSLDITELKAMQDRLARSEERLQLALGASTMVGIWDWDLKTDLIYADPNFAEIYTVEPERAVAGAPLQEYTRNFHPDDMPEFEAELARVFCGQPTFEAEYRIVQPDGGVRWVHARGRLIRNGAGAPIRFSGAAVEITDRKRAEETQKLLMHELAHRVKNTLAVVQAITTQSLRHASSIEDAGQKLHARLAALAKAHDVLTQDDWRGAALNDVVANTVCNIGMQDSDRIRVRGKRVILGPQAAMSFGLVLHELMTNAVKYGALSNDHGYVDIEWSVALEDNGEAFHLKWSETGGPVVAVPEHKGFGSRLIKSSLGSMGSVDVLYHPAGLELRMSASMAQIEAASDRHGTSMLR
ncbi:PAS domain-containing protein [Rhizobium sp. L245/93]|uniref:PAS domain-containing protein n=1 Tax=Rhizobium sp. L245/93 TaxID=2819998 RepID=UPI001AD96CF4|nr:PAS domain-containing protein [Rhizobium sp. L245/93]MBO9172316.1 PAS domain-containing protein [Rhizobium sp. L245/93]